MTLRSRSRNMRHRYGRGTGAVRALYGGRRLLQSVRAAAPRERPKEQNVAQLELLFEVHEAARRSGRRRLASKELAPQRQVLAAAVAVSACCCPSTPTPSLLKLAVDAVRSVPPERGRQGRLRIACCYLDAEPSVTLALCEPRQMG